MVRDLFIAGLSPTKASLGSFSFVEKPVVLAI